MSSNVAVFHEPGEPEDKDPLFKQPCGAAHCDKKFIMPRMPGMPRTRSSSESEAERQKKSHNSSGCFLAQQFMECLPVLPVVPFPLSFPFLGAKIHVSFSCFRAA